VGEGVRACLCRIGEGRMGVGGDHRNCPLGMGGDRTAVATIRTRRI
jgi:hypothetical protein